ncbi:LPS-assembly protein LptD [Kiloniella sp. EL199]|uniref:LPS-assembly protein LptD n=1 Tax=Kiloniella sp. EL199 TaxID=2107581 RepID=UPI000EA3D923|nr:LPS assembly protein LptD [Kiloniella sp. EL199]
MSFRGVKTLLRSSVSIAVLSFAIAMSVSAKTSAQSIEGINEEIPALISADEVTYDENLGIVTASGNVEISQGERTVLANSVSYNMNTNVVSATGNISLLEPSGDIVFAEHVELTDNLKEGFIRDIRILLTDRSRLAASTGQLTSGNISVFSNGVFSPCELCKDDPSRAPIWQLKAKKIVHNKESQTIKYDHAWMEIFGVPVIYTPYLAHPDPTVKRRSGFLLPSYGTSTQLGITLQIPYYWAIDDSSELLFAPIATTKQGIVLAGEYEKKFNKGDLSIEASATIADRDDEDDKFRGQIISEGRFDLDKTWRWGFNVERASDDTYGRVYGFNNDSELETSAFIEGFRGRNFARLDSYKFQSTRNGVDDSENPFVFPRGQYHFQSQPGVTGATYRLDANAQALGRSEGRDSRRVSLISGWDLPYTGSWGDQYKLTTQLQTDGYWVNGVNKNNDDIRKNGDTFTGFTGRVFPQMALEWRFPFASHRGNFSQTIEPIVQGVLAPNGSNPNEIPNDDSRDFEFDDTSLFSLNRFAGTDRVDSGSRVSYGLKWTASTVSGNQADFLIGQSYRFSGNSNLHEKNSGLKDAASDIVGHIGIYTIDNFDALYRFRFDPDDLGTNRNEVELNIGPAGLNLDLDYVFLKNDNVDGVSSDREEVKIGINSELTEYWSLNSSYTRDIDADESREASLGLIYHDECIIIDSQYTRTWFQDRELEPDNRFTLQLTFKHLGTIQPL